MFLAYQNRPWSFNAHKNLILVESQNPEKSTCFLNAVAAAILGSDPNGFWLDDDRQYEYNTLVDALFRMLETLNQPKFSFERKGQHLEMTKILPHFDDTCEVMHRANILKTDLFMRFLDQCPINAPEGFKGIVMIDQIETYGFDDEMIPRNLPFNLARVMPNVQFVCATSNADECIEDINQYPRKISFDFTELDA